MLTWDDIGTCHATLQHLLNFCWSTLFSRSRMQTSLSVWLPWVWPHAALIQLTAALLMELGHCCAGDCYRLPLRELTKAVMASVAKVPAAAPNPATSQVLGKLQGALPDASSLLSFQKSESSLEGTCFLPLAFNGAGSMPHLAFEVSVPGTLI